VKGEDLLFLDYPNTRLRPDERLRYSALGLEAVPFESVGILTPPRRGEPETILATGTRQVGVKPYFWTIAEFCSQQLLPFLFADEEDQRQQYMTVVHSVAAQLVLCAEKSTEADGSVRIGSNVVRCFSELVGAIEEQLLPDGKPDHRWAGRAIGASTIQAFQRRLYASERHVEHLIRADTRDVPERAIDLGSHQVTVVDIHELHDRAKHFVVGAVLRRAFEDREQSSVGRPLLFVVLDELNRFAPRDSNNPIKEVLLDVAEWGRALGIVLIGAQQTASEVEHRVVANSAIRVVGRLDSAEAREEQCGFLPGVQRRRATILRPGFVFLAQPRVPVPLLVEFPFPAWATRPAEADLSEATSASVPAEPYGRLK